MQVGRSARASDLQIRIIRQGTWWRLDYSRGGVAFTTANEIHVPAGVSVTMTWTGAPPPWIGSATCLPLPHDQCAFVADAPSTNNIRFIGLWPPMWRSVRLIVQPRDQFDRWFSNEAQPARIARAGDGVLFRNAGCAYCHVIRGVVDEPSLLAPDLTHFAMRTTIAASNLPNHRGPLTAWIVNPKSLKRGAEMPDNPLAADDLRTIVTLLESLR